MKEAAALFFIIIFIAFILFYLGSTFEVVSNKPVCLLSNDPIMCAQLSKNK